MSRLLRGGAVDLSLGWSLTSEYYFMHKIPSSQLNNRLLIFATSDFLLHRVFDSIRLPLQFITIRLLVCLFRTFPFHRAIDFVLRFNSIRISQDLKTLFTQFCNFSELTKKIGRRAESRGSSRKMSQVKPGMKQSRDATGSDGRRTIRRRR